MAHLLGRTIGETRQQQVAHAVVLHAVIGHLRLLDVATGEHEAQGLVLLPGAFHHHLHRGAGIAAQHFGHLRGGLTLHIHAIHALQHVTGLQTGLQAGRSRQGLCNHHAFQLPVIADDAADSRILTRRQQAEVLVVFLIIRGKGIHTLQHALDGPLNGGIGTQRVHIVSIQQAIDVAKHLQIARKLGLACALSLSQSRYGQQRRKGKGKKTFHGHEDKQRM